MGKTRKGKKGAGSDEGEKINLDLEAEETSSMNTEEKGLAKGKKKKDQKTKRDEELEEVEKEIEAMGINDKCDEIKEKTSKPGKKEKKKKSKKDLTEDSDEEFQATPQKKGFALLATGNEIEEVEVEAPIPKPKVKKNSRKTAPMSVFELLEVEDANFSGGSEEELETKPKPKPKTEKQKKGKVSEKVESTEISESVDDGERTKGGKGGKKGKKKKGKKEEEEDEIEKILAELELEYSGKKKKDNKTNETKTENIAEDKDEEQGKVDNKVSKKKKKDKEEEKVVKEESKVIVKTEKLTETEIGDEIKEGDKKIKKKKKDKEAEAKNVDLDEEKTKEIGDEELGTVKTAAETRKETDKQRKVTTGQQEDAGEKDKEQETTGETESQIKKATPEADTAAKKEEASDKSLEEDDDDDDFADTKKKKKKGRLEAKKGKKGPGKKALAAMHETLQKIKQEEERIKREEEERIRKQEEEEKARLEKLKKEQEKKELKKQREKEKKERLKAEGKFMTKKQMQANARAQHMIEMMRAQGMALPEVGEKKTQPTFRVRPVRQKSKSSDAADTDASVDKKIEPAKQESEKEEVEKVEVKIVNKEPVKEEENKLKKTWEQEEVKETWDAGSSNDEEDKSEEIPKKEVKIEIPSKQEEKKKEYEEESEESEEEEEDEDEDEEEEEEHESSEESSEESVSEEHMTDAERKRERALARIQKRREEAEKNKSIESLRCPVICVLGHVDTGKTKILDKLRRTHVQDGEAGGITQQIGATNVPIEAIMEQARMIKNFVDLKIKVPGLLIIDTPGHESFSNLRSRGSSLCDIAILVVDVMHGLEPQTIESLNLLKSRKTPFVIALNKIDRLYDWNPNPNKDVKEVIKSQQRNTQMEFEKKMNEVILQMAEQGMNAAVFYDNPDVKTYVSMVPTSAITGDGMGNLMALLVSLTQNMLAKRLMFSNELQATVLEVKAIPGLGTTIDIILVNGSLREGDTMVVAGTDGPIVTQIRSLLMPQPMKELRVKNSYTEFKQISAAQGVKIAAKDLEKAIAGLNLQIAYHPDEVEILQEEVANELKSALNAIKLKERGVYVQASTLGSLEALLEFLKASKVPYSGIRIGPVVKRDVVKASAMLEHDSQYAVILAFDVKIERDAQEMADSLGVRIFQADIIYHLFDRFMEYRDELKSKKREEFKHIAVFPCKLKILPQFVFNSRDPIVVGVIVEAGIVKEGTPIVVPTQEFVDLGVVTSVESNHKSIESARKGQEVCIKIEPIPGDAPKMFGRHFDEKDLLVSKISRQSIDACKDYFRDDLLKSDWQLIVELKKVFQIL